MNEENERAEIGKGSTNLKETTFNKICKLQKMLKKESSHIKLSKPKLIYF